MRTTLLTLILLIQSVAFGAETKGLLEDLRLLKAREAKRFFNIRKQLITAGTENVEALRERFREHKGRTDLLDRLIFYTDTHYKTGDEKQFLKSACLKLAEREVQNADLIGNGFWQFYRNVSEVMAEAKETDLTAVALLESFIAYSSVTKPKPAKGFMGPRDYTNGETYESANTVSKEAVGDYVGGSNHVLPTARSARFSSGLSVLDFVKRTSILRLGPDQLRGPM